MTMLSILEMGVGYLGRHQNIEHRAGPRLWNPGRLHHVGVGASYDRRMHSIALQRLCLLLSRPADRNAV